MKIADYIQSMPKVELNLQLHGAMKPQTIATIADQNDIAENTKHFQNWVRLLSTPEYNKLDDIIRMASSWVQQPDDLKLLVYEAATALHKQNVRYAEIGIDPSLYAALALQADDFLALINDGRDRAQRAWGIRINWIITMGREEPRRAEETIRWATTMAARKGGIVAVGLGGRESLLPVGQFERPFKQAEKREVARVVRAGDEQGAEGILSSLAALVPNRILDARGAADSPEVLEKLREGNVTLNLNLSRALKHGWVKSLNNYPLRALYDAGITVTLGSDMPSLYQTSLVGEYQKALDNELVTLDELDEIALNAVRASFLPDDEKAAMVETFKAEYAGLRELVEA
jgi:adenosine deaminase